MIKFKLFIISEVTSHMQEILSVVQTILHVQCSYHFKYLAKMVNDGKTNRF